MALGGTGVRVVLEIQPGLLYEHMLQPIELSGPLELHHLTIFKCNFENGNFLTQPRITGLEPWRKEVSLSLLMLTTGSVSPHALPQPPFPIFSPCSSWFSQDFSNENERKAIAVL